MRIVYIGTVEFSRKALEKLIQLKADIVGVLTMEDSAYNADFADLSELCKKHGISCMFVKDINAQQSQEWIKDKRPDIVFCFGLSQILKNNILKIAPKGVLGYHPAKLPSNRGRHPLIWALALGLEKTASTFFFMDEGVDSGDILSQEDIGIEYSDNAHTLYRKITETALRQIESFLPKLEGNNYSRITQDDSRANNWRKRGQDDGRIDFKMNSRSIYNLVRALTKPYIGAHLLYKGKEIKVWAATEEDYGSVNIEYGKVLEISQGGILVKCCGGAIRLVEHEFEVLPKAGEYLL